MIEKKPNSGDIEVWRYRYDPNLALFHTTTAAFCATGRSVRE